MIFLFRSVADFEKRRVFALVLGLLFCCVSCVGSIVSTDHAGPVLTEREFPEFLPECFKPFMDEYGLMCVGTMSTSGVVNSTFSTRDKSLRLTVTHLECNHPQQATVFNRIIGNINKAVSTNSGSFIKISETDFECEILQVKEGSTSRVFGFVLQSAVQIWDFSIVSGGDELAENLLPLINRQRYVEALNAGNVSMGHWEDAIHDYALWLLENGKTKDAVKVLSNHLKTSAYDYDAHTDFFLQTDDNTAATNSASIVFRNAEDQKLIDQAADFLGRKKASLNDFPVLQSGEKGLQLILLPLPPCNPWLLESSADIFKEITGIPTKICNLSSEWVWKKPNRICRERDVQKMLAGVATQPISFEGWDKSRYIDELQSMIDTNNALSEYYIGKWIEMVEDEPGQYLVDEYLAHLGYILSAVRSDDVRTMYVGITEANIYSGDNGYLFSQGGGAARASIFSYYMMQGAQIRSRLVERIGKELVPAALKQLGIERSTDPSCPYSYANGVGRLDEKTKNLSESVKKALSRLKTDSR